MRDPNSNYRSPTEPEVGGCYASARAGRGQSQRAAVTSAVVVEQKHLPSPEIPEIESIPAQPWRLGGLLIGVVVEGGKGE